LLTSDQFAMSFDDQPPGSDDTIIDAGFDARRPLKSMLPGPAVAPAELLQAGNARQFKIRAADDHGRRSSASVLLSRMYATRGYHSPALAQHQHASRVTLIASEGDETIGTITVGFDSPARLLVDDLFADEADGLRASGHRLCEFTKLAMDSVVKSKRVLASLFHVAHIYAHHVMGLDSLLIEVNPRHVLYYERMLGFRLIGKARHNPRVNAPAVLLCLNLFHARDQIDRFGGKPEYSLLERSLYPYFFSPAEEEGIVRRLESSQARPRHEGTALATGTHAH
jgi:hypothetical protein